MSDAGAVARASELAALGHRSSIDQDARDRLLAALAEDNDPRARAAAVGALARAGPHDQVDWWLRALDDPAPEVRRRAADVAPTLGDDRRVASSLLPLLDDSDVTVVEAATWALGELGERARAAGAVDALARIVREHRDALAREAAVAALGALGDRAALGAILDACHDKPAVRRRAVLALAPFDGADVDAAIDAALRDRDWQVRQAAEDLRAD
jgi:HEAT repeat protein